MDQGSFLDAIIWFVMLTILFYLNREIEIVRLVNEIEKYLRMYKAARDKALNATLSEFKAVIAKHGERVDIKKLEERINALIEISFIEPVSLDPFGIVRKLKHLLISSEETLKEEVRRLAPSASESDLENLLNMISATRLLNLIYKIVDHIYRIGRKFKSIWILMQLSAQLPFVTEEVRALEGAIDAFAKGLPIGDSVGPIVAAKMIHDHNALETIIEPVENTIVARLSLDGREVLVIKAKGPGGTTGRLDDALEWVFDYYRGDITAIITVDAALKLESEESGTISEGFGVAMGGIGVERFNIEKIATERGVPLYAVLIKMSEEEALSVLDEKLYASVERVIKVVERMIRERVPSGGRVIVIGVGNTVGVFP